MEGVNNAFCMSKEEYELARLATKCAGLQGKIDDQAASIEHYKSGLDSAMQDIAKLKVLCDQMGNALEVSCSKFPNHLRQVSKALNAWREMKC